MEVKIERIIAVQTGITMTKAEIASLEAIPFFSDSDEF
jgi:hypothetical protein